ncbi:predicted protein [Streptomyces viridosporus ATCC 14672]|uniref:Predicted protein n=1 Tax=Streptomyces viridosporus (strain ATCC 14672 / DSM 40746 / JCM 4963 / KCTC 9882 / NRRL B-12104 / FH 1290) TaxID=566461 RepID=D5ZTB8_STRV1|nr:predicted protein [Streptomyces viridosporus ATCC 14672]
MNWLITSSGASMSLHDFSSWSIRIDQSLRASWAAFSLVSSWVTPTRTHSPSPSIAPTVSPSTTTLAPSTLCTTARIRPSCRSANSRPTEVRASPRPGYFYSLTAIWGGSGAPGHMGAAWGGTMLAHAGRGDG